MPTSNFVRSICHAPARAKKTSMSPLLPYPGTARQARTHTLLTSTSSRFPSSIALPRYLQGRRGVLQIVARRLRRLGASSACVHRPRGDGTTTEMCVSTQSPWTESHRVSMPTRIKSKLKPPFMLDPLLSMPWGSDRMDSSIRLLFVACSRLWCHTWLHLGC